MKNTKAAAAALAIVLFASGCGGSADTAAVADAVATTASTSVVRDDRGPEPEGATFVDLEEPSRLVADALVSRYSDAEAFLAVAYGLERGYDIVQIGAAAVAGTLGADGTIGNTEPTGAPVGRLQLPPDSAEGEGAFSFSVNEDELVLYYAQNLIEGLTLLDAMRSAAAVAEVGNEEAEAGKTMVALITSLAGAGYNLEQIIDALVLDAAVLTQPNIYTIAPGDCPNQVNCLHRLDACIGLSEPPAGRGNGSPCSALLRNECAPFSDRPGDLPACADLYLDYDPSQDAPQPSDDEPEEPAIDDGLWNGPLMETISYQGQGERGVFGELELLDVEYAVMNGMFDVVVTRTSWLWQRGGPDPLDRNCGARMVESYAGGAPLGDLRIAESGTEGRSVWIQLEVVTSQAIDRSGTLCDLVDWTRVEREPGRPGGTISGVVGAFGFEGEFGGAPVVSESVG